MKIITVGKQPKDYIASGIETYSKRLKGNFKLNWVFVPHSPSKQSEVTKKQESEQILRYIDDKDFVILLDETGKNISSPELAKILDKNISRQITFIIGGAFGVDQSIKTRANFVWSLSKLVFPHQIVRLILTEQIYRAQTILDNHPYHHQ